MTIVSIYEQMRKWVVEFLIKFESRGIKILRVNYKTSTPKLPIYFYFLRVVASSDVTGVHRDLDVSGGSVTSLEFNDLTS